jgi:hypothetical protein
MSKIESEPIPDLKSKNYHKRSDIDLIILISLLCIAWFVVGYSFKNDIHINDYHSFTKAYNSRCDYYIECIGSQVKNITLTNCIPLSNFTCG